VNLGQCGECHLILAMERLQETPRESHRYICRPHSVSKTPLRHSPDNLRPFRINFIDTWRLRLHRKRFTWHAINQESNAGREFGEAGEIFGGNLAGVFAELLGDAFCVVAADLEGDDGADVAEDGVGGFFVELGQILMGDDQQKAILAGFAEDGCKTSGSKVLEFINVKRRITAFDFRDVRSGHGCLLNAGNQQRSEQRGIVFAESAFRQVHDQYLPSVYDVSQIKRPSRLTHDSSDIGAGQKRTQFVLDRRDRFRTIVVGPAREFMHPE
jgi:hypothetical protein